MKIAKIKGPYNIKKMAIVSVIICFGLIFIFWFTRSEENLNNLSGKKSRNPDAVISPVPDQGQEKKADYRGYLSRVGYEPIIYLENVVYNWQNLFDIFTSNPENSYLRYTISTPSLEKLTIEVKTPKVEFFKGSSDEIIEEYGKVIKEEAKYYKLDWHLILAMIKQESNFTSNAVSSAGAYGFMQIMPRTGSKLEQTLNLEDHTSPINNLIAGIYYYALLVGRYDAAGDTNKYKLALAAYNAGSSHIEDAMTIAYFHGKDYLKWENVRETLKMLGPENDSLHIKIWGTSPPGGRFTNWREPVNYVNNIIYFWSEYKKIYKK
jgi:soluble lytic murein transglycosylase-like protein